MQSPVVQIAALLAAEPPLALALTNSLVHKQHQSRETLSITRQKQKAEAKSTSQLALASLRDLGEKATEGRGLCNKQQS